MDTSFDAADPITPEWCAAGFDHMSPHLGRQLHETMTCMRAGLPVARSEEHGRFSIIIRYEDVLRVAQDWASFSSDHGITVPAHETSMPAIPEMVDPPLHCGFTRLINAWFTPAVITRQEGATRDLVTRLIDGFIEDGACGFQTAFAQPLPSLVFSRWSCTRRPNSSKRSTGWPPAPRRRTTGRASRPAPRCSGGSTTSSSRGGSRAPEATSSTPSSTPRSRAAPSPGPRSSGSSSS